VSISDLQYGILSVAIFSRPFLTLKSSHHHMNKITKAGIVVLAFLPLSCNSEAKIPGNISFVFPPSGYAHDHRQQLTQECLDGIRHDLPMIDLHEFTVAFTIQFVESRQEMKKYTGNPASGVTILEPQKIVYLLANEKEKGAPIDHELMHMITQAEWGYPDRTSLWMNEGLAAFSQNNCNGYNDEQIYRYFAASRMLLPMDSLTNQFYQEPEMIAYHQSAYLVQYLLQHYGVEKFRNLWQQGFNNFQPIYGVTFSEVVKDTDMTVKRDYPTAPDIDWKKFSVGCY
jgi:hypothetical protein